MSSSDNSKQGSKGKPCRRYGRKPEEERKGIPMLRYGKGNNFYMFRETLSEVAMEKFGVICYKKVEFYLRILWLKTCENIRKGCVTRRSHKNWIF
jgi:hypothetical protein